LPQKYELPQPTGTVWRGGNDQVERADLAMEQRVGRDRGAVSKPGDGVRFGADVRKMGIDAALEPDRGICWRARDLGDPDGARGTVEADDVGECPQKNGNGPRVTSVRP
jgi:hypothetical protein